ncbi:class I adenylate-forming enzyme family protein [Lacrimispora amygdalina]|uniref:class I adenylate-forming enzyme family protein n=1 Tax=Lacrimispora amygdalina TaxID=253257 RepID=UPI000BE29D5D|nr:class I adenylate-forming enzyme family protein [Lacrimispora amygdalina]
MSKICDIFFTMAAKYPQKTAIWCDNKTVTYEKLASLVNGYSYFMFNHGVCYGDHIGFPMNNSIESAALILAAADLGAALVPINPTLPPETIKSLFAAADVNHLIARKNFLEQTAGETDFKFSGVQFCLDDTWENALSLELTEAISERPPVHNQVTGEETLIITMTSGSTGVPKPIDLTQINKLKRARAHIRLYNLTKEDRILAATPLYHSLAERLVLMPLLIGATSILMPRFTPSLWLNCIKNQRVTFTIAVSAQLGQIAELLTSPFVPEIDSLRCVVSSSSLLENHIKNELIDKLNCDFLEMYGTTETSTVTSINFRETVNKKNSVGKPLPEAEVKIIKEDQSAALPGEIGEITCKTALMCSGYYGLPEVFQNAMQDGYFRTGDLGYLDEDGYLYFTGRKKELIITGGINVYPQDIEACIKKLPEVKECAAFAYPDNRLGEVVALAVVPVRNTKLSKRNIQFQCAKNLADFQQPHLIVFLAELPKNSLGKVEKYNLVEYVTKHGVFK